MDLGSVKELVDLVADVLDRRRDDASRKTPAGHVQPAVDRMKHVIQAHGMTIPQFVRLLPPEMSVPLSRFRDDVTIAEGLTPGLLRWTADLFGIQLDWLETSTEDVYGVVPQAYKHVDRFVAWLEENGWWTEDLRMIVFTSEASLEDVQPPSPMAIAFTRPLPALPETELRQFLPTSDLWDWGHPPSQRDTILLARKVSDMTGPPAHVYRAPVRLVERLQHRTEVPNPTTLKGCRAVAQFLE